MWKLSANLILLILLAVPTTGAAQEWLQDREDSEGPGIKLGDSLLFHPGGAIEGGYDTNTLRRNTKETVLGAGRLRPSLYLDLATRNSKRKVKDDGVLDVTPPKVDFSLGSAVYYDVYFPVKNDEKKLIKNANTLGIDFKTNLIVLPGAPFSFLADLMYLRTSDPSESVSDATTSDTIRPGIGFKLTPGGGTLSLELGYRFDYKLFENSGIAARNNKMVNDLRFITSWKVLPKTALITKILFSPINYTGSEGVNNDSMPVRASFGLQGLLTKKFGLSLFAGYGASLYKQKTSGDFTATGDFNSIIASGALMFFITPFSNIRIGGERDFADSFYANFYTRNGGFLSYEQMFGGVFLASLKGRLESRKYSSTTGSSFEGYTASSDNREDIWIAGTLLLEWRIQDWISIHTTVKYEGDVTDFEWSGDEGTNYEGFHRVEVFGGVRVHY